jgi:hypothetical protein
MSDEKVQSKMLAGCWDDDGVQIDDKWYDYIPRIRISSSAGDNNAIISLSAGFLRSDFANYANESIGVYSGRRVRCNFIDQNKYISSSRRSRCNFSDYNHDAVTKTEVRGDSSIGNIRDYLSMNRYTGKEDNSAPSTFYLGDYVYGNTAMVKDGNGASRLCDGTLYKDVLKSQQCHFSQLRRKYVRRREVLRANLKSSSGGELLNFQERSDITLGCRLPDGILKFLDQEDTVWK